MAIYVGKSHLASYGSNSLKHLKKLSSFDVFVSQQKKYDIVNGLEKYGEYQRPAYPYWRKPKEVSKKVT